MFSKNYRQLFNRNVRLIFYLLNEITFKYAKKKLYLALSKYFIKKAGLSYRKGVPISKSKYWKLYLKYSQKV